MRLWNCSALIKSRDDGTFGVPRADGDYRYYIYFGENVNICFVSYMIWRGLLDMDMTRGVQCKFKNMLVLDGAIFETELHF